MKCECEKLIRQVKEEIKPLLFAKTRLDELMRGLKQYHIMLNGISFLHISGKHNLIKDN